MLQGKTVLLGVTGGIAAYKAAALASALVKQHCQVEVVMTEHATKFVTPLTFEQQMCIRDSTTTSPAALFRMQSALVGSTSAPE